MAEETAIIYKQLTQLHTWLELDLGCPLIPRSTQKTGMNSEDVDEIFKGNADLKWKMQNFIGNGKQRLNMFEWLLNQYDASIFDGLKDDNQVDKIVIALKEIGIVNYNDKRGGTHHELDKSVQGLNGLSDSVSLLHRLTKFVIHSIQVDLMTSKTLTSASDKLLNHLSANSQTIFQSNVRLFPPGFPLDSGAGSSYLDLDGLATLVDDLNSRLENLDSKVKNLQITHSTDVYLQNIDSIKYASESDIEQLRVAMLDLTKNVRKFNSEYSHIQESAGHKTEVMTALGKHVAKCQEQRSNFDNMSSQFNQVIEKIGHISARLQMVGLDTTGDMTPKFRENINNEMVLELVSQIKSLKISVACNQKFGQLYG